MKAKLILSDVGDKEEPSVMRGARPYKLEVE